MLGRSQYQVLPTTWVVQNQATGNKRRFIIISTLVLCLLGVYAGYIHSISSHDISFHELGEIAQARYILPEQPSAEYTTSFFESLESFIDLMPASLRTPLLQGLAVHRRPHTSLLSSIDTTAASNRPMVSYRNFFQTDKNPPGKWTREWEKVNAADGWILDYYEDVDANAWVEKEFAAPPETRGVLWAWEYMRRGVLRADFLRYLLPLVKGGVYSDTDTRPVRPIMEWGKLNVETMDISATDGGNWASKQGYDPQVVVAVDVDVHRRLDWHEWWPRALGICQWTLASAPHHPIFLEVVRRVVNATEAVAAADRALDVVEWTGPGVFTDAVLAYLLARYDVTWHRLRGLNHPLRIGEVMILPITAFSPGGEPDFGAEEKFAPQNVVIHHFAGSWKGDGP